MNNYIRSRFFSNASKPFKANESNCKMTSSNQVQKKRAGNEKGNVFRFTCQLNFERHPYHRRIRWNCDAFYHCVYFFLFDDFPFLHQFFFTPNAWVFAFCCLCVLYFYLTWSKYKVNQRKRNITMKRWECTAHASVESTWTNGKTNQSISYSLINHSKATAFVRGPAFTMMRSRSRSHPHSHHRQKVL